MNETYCFRHEFRYDPNEWQDTRGFKLSLESKLPAIDAWLNGKPLDVGVGGKQEIQLSLDALAKGRNVLAVAVRPATDEEEQEKKAKAAKAKAVNVRPEAELPPREGDQDLSKDQLAKLGLFARLTKMPNVEQFPGSIVLRKFNKGDVICSQGEPGASAFYILSTEDRFALKKADVAFQSDALKDVTPGELEKFDAQKFVALLKTLTEQLQQLQQTQQTQGDRGQIEKVRRDVEELLKVAPLAERTLKLRDAEPRDERRQAAAAFILPVATRLRAGGLLGRIRRLFGGGSTPLDDSPEYIRNDGPADVDYQTRRAPMYEGDLFGEMACLTNAPRSATIVAETDCYMLEFLKNVFNLIQKDDGYQKQMLKTYRERVLSTHVQNLEFFRGLTGEQIKKLGENIGMKIVDAGTVICNEGEPSDYVYIIRTGLVQVVQGIKGVNVALRREDVPDWPAFCRKLMDGDPGVVIPCPQCGHELLLPDRSFLGRKGRCPQCEHKFVMADPAEAEAEVELELADASQAKDDAAAKPPAKRPPAKSGPKGKGKAGGKKQVSDKETVWRQLTRPVQLAIRRVASGQAQEGDEREIVLALNELIKNRDFVSEKAFSPIIKKDPVLNKIPHRPNKWSGLQVCLAGRLILQQIYPDVLNEPPECDAEGPQRILAYLGSGDIFGETGVVLNERRSATCIAYDHPDAETRNPGQVELITIAASAFDQLLDESPDLRSRLNELIEKRQEESRQAKERPVWDLSHSIMQSDEFQDMGFIQGQKLMLIDLDSCTRCGDCVRACINTHEDGYSRLFLDGPRFDRFLVPSACRNCIDPACMIGCPVGSIQRGDNGQIVIRDWCIGCEKCAKQCPYDSIQMHDTGVVREVEANWRYRPRSAIKSDNWTKPRFNDSDWSSTISPVTWNLDFRDGLVAARQGGSNGSENGDPELDLKYNDKILSVRLDVDRKPPRPPGAESSGAELQIQALPKVAVVCDQCSTRPNKEPACVEYCPHEAAMRVEARFEFPIGMSDNVL